MAVSALLALIFGVAYSHLFVGLCGHLGILGWERTIRAAILPAAYAGLLASLVGAYKPEVLDTAPLGVFAFIELACAIHVALFASVASEWSKSGFSAIANGPPNLDRMDLHWAILGLGLTMLTVVIWHILLRQSVELFALNLILLGILTIPVVIVERMTRIFHPRHVS